MARAPTRNLKTDTLSQDNAVTHRCYECGGEVQTSRRAMTIPCKHCGKTIRLEDVTVTRYESRRDVATTGVITVDKKGELLADRLRCNGLIVRGSLKVKQPIDVGGPVLVGPAAVIRGDIKAPTLATGPGATFDGHHEVGDVDQLPWRKEKGWSPLDRPTDA